jgi:hypothetical protein
MRHVVVMVTTSYPRFEGDHVGTFMEPIAKHVAARGHDVHIVAPWHPLVARGRVEDGVSFHFFKYAPVPALNVFGYAAGMRADVALRGAAWAAAPLAMTAGWFKAMRVAQKQGATVMHGHWVVPGGAIASAARPSLPASRQPAWIGRVRRGADGRRADGSKTRLRPQRRGDSVQPRSCGSRDRARRRSRSHGGRAVWFRPRALQAVDAV